MSKSRLAATGDDIDGDSEKQVKIWHHNALNPQKSAKIFFVKSFFTNKTTKKSVKNKDNLTRKRIIKAKINVF